MSDVRCWRCNKKLGHAEPGANGVVIVCPRCGVSNRVGGAPLDSEHVKA